MTLSEWIAENIYLPFMPPEIKHVYHIIKYEDLGWKCDNKVYPELVSNNGWVCKSILSDAYDIEIKVPEKAMLPWHTMKSKKSLTPQIFDTKAWVIWKAMHYRIKQLAEAKTVGKVYTL